MIAGPRLAPDTAVALADQRSADAVATTGVLAAVMLVYGLEFDRVLQAHGTDRDEVQERQSRT